MRVAVVADHNGLALAASLVRRLDELGHDALDRSPAHPLGEDGTVDYPRLCEDVCRRVLAGTVDRAVVVGGSGMGEVVACNKLPGIRAGLCHEELTTRISRANNDSTVMVVGAKVVDAATAEHLLELWLSTPFTGGVHARRLEQVAVLERGGTLL